MSSIRQQAHIVEVKGDFGCFTRPEMKVERFSYPCPTPSAARGMLEAIYFKPEFYWQVDKVELLSLPSYIALRRNEVKSVTSTSLAKQWMKGTASPRPILADDPEQRQQRQTMALRSPRYRLHARIIPRPGQENKQKAFDDQFIRRATQGKCYMQPYLGCREFVAYFEYIALLEGRCQPVDYRQELGWMLYDVFDLSQVNTNQAKPFISLFEATIRDGILEVPPYESDTVRKPERRAG
jgi:CRISPR-associated protein Cas5d